MDEVSSEDGIWVNSSVDWVPGLSMLSVQINSARHLQWILKYKHTRENRTCGHVACSSNQASTAASRVANQLILDYEKIKFI